VKLAPKLKSYLRTDDPAWPDVIEAAAYLRSDLGVSKSLGLRPASRWAGARAAIAIAIVSAKDASHFRTTAHGYFHGIVTKAEAGQLNLDRRCGAWGKQTSRAPQERPVLPGAGQGRGVRRRNRGTEKPRRKIRLGHAAICWNARARASAMLPGDRLAERPVSSGPPSPFSGSGGPIRRLVLAPF
jgi:hypothetical protein